MLDATIHDLTIIVVCAAAVSYVFSRFNWPVILGYLLAGVLVGPNPFYDSPILNRETVENLSELGVMFLMFYIGLEFDLSKLKSLLGSALPAVLLQTIGMIFLGVMTAPVFGWSSVNGLFLGGVLAISSTMVTFSVMREQGALSQSYGQLALGILILEDIVAIILLVLLAGVGETSVFAWSDVGQSVFLVCVFVTVTYVLGKLLTPKLLSNLEKLASTEVVLLVIMALLMGLSFMADYFHFSIALGSFVAGAILANSILSHQIETFTEPFRHLFSAIFFVTVGMLIDPRILMEQWAPILLVAFLVIFGKVTTCYLGLGLSGQNLRSSFRAALSKAQIGEFSFIISKLGQSLGVTDPRFESLTVGVALVTILATPVLSARSDRLYDVLSNRVPEPIKKFNKLYSNLLTIIHERLSKSELFVLIRLPLLQILGHFLLFSGVIIGSSLGADYLAHLPHFVDYAVWIEAGTWVAAAIICLPFLVAVIRNLDAITMLITESVLNRAIAQQFMGGRLGHMVHNILLCVVCILFGGIFLSAATTYLPTGVSLFVFTLLLLGVGIFAWKKLLNINSRLENLFMESLEHHVRQDANRKKADLEKISNQYPWPINLEQIFISEQLCICGKSIEDLQLRQKTGASVLAIGRGGYVHYHPHPSTILFPGDCLYLIGDEAQNRQAKQILNRQWSEGQLKPAFGGGFKATTVLLNTDSTLVGETLVGADLRRLYGVTIIALQRGDKKIYSPLPEEMLHAGDLLLVVGGDVGLQRFADRAAG